MEPFDNLKGKLREESPLPDGFGWDDMQEGIFEKMADEPVRVAPPKRFKYWRLTFFLLGMTAMLGLITVFHLLTNPENSIIEREQPIVEQQIPSIKKAIADQVKPLMANTIDDEPHKQEDITNTIYEKQINQPTEIISNNKTSTNVAQKTSVIAAPLPETISEKTVNASINERQISTDNLKIIEDRNQNLKEFRVERFTKISTTNQQDNISLNIGKVELPIIAVPPTAFNNNSIQQDMRVYAKNSTKQGSNNLALAHLKIMPVKALEIPRLETIPLPILNNPLAEEKWEKPTRFFMAIGVGVNYWSPNFNNVPSINQETATYEKALVGNSYSLQLGYQFHSNWAMSSGILWSKNYSKFDYKHLDTYQKTKPAALVEIQVNSLSGDSTLIYGDRVVNVERIRTVKHYNSFQKWAIPITLKYSLSNRKMEYAFGVGTLLTLTTKTAGKTLNPTITDYNSTNPIYKTGFEIGAMGSFDLNYHFSEIYFVGAQLSAVKSLTNWRRTNDVILKPTVFHSQLRIGLKF